MHFSRSEIAYNEIKKRIMEGQWQPGQTLSTYKLAEELKISRTPIIAALKALEQEGLLEIEPQVGCKLKEPNPQTAREHFLIRAALEGLAAELAVENATEDDIAYLKETLKKAQEALKKGDELKYAECNRDFHLKIAAISGSEQLRQLIHNFWYSTVYFGASISFLTKRSTNSIKEHSEVIEAIKKGEGERARNLLETHLRSCQEDFCGYLEEKEKTEANSTAKSVITY